MNLQIRHSKWVAAKFVFLNDLQALIREAPAFCPGLFYTVLGLDKDVVKESENYSSKLLIVLRL
jgi:hypothetical protein